MKQSPKPCHPLQKWIEQNCLFVTKLKVQMTADQCEKILTEFPDKNLVAETLLEMDNYKPLTRRYQSVYLTLRNWLRRNIDLRDNPPAPAPRKRGGWTCSYHEALDYLQKRNIDNSKLTEEFEMVKRDGQKPLWRKL